MAKSSRISADKAIEEMLHFIENSDCESDKENNEDLANNDLCLFNGNEENFIYEQTDIENEIQEQNEQEKEDERRTQRYLKQWAVKRLVNGIEIALDIGNYNPLALLENTTLNTT